ncbi:hypothetical protein L6452_43168 [Arctium lappa]|uniref:Uncharacterized protein n=1 Tax=Arctium lappa TaxID=4217 RepID=A0ACB8XK97_ARCLA|nr:hypothetical protein L6452_43168 [Arctium lappa]
MEHEIKSESSDDGLPADNPRAPSDVHSTELLISNSDLLNLVNSDEHNFQEIIAHKFHGVEGLAKVLHVNLKHGLVSSKDEERRRIVFGTNTYKPPSWKCFHHFLLGAFKDSKKLILLACAVATLGFGIKDHGVQEGYYEIVGILATIMVAAISATTNFYQVKGNFDRLSELHNKIKIDVLRGGMMKQIPIFNVVVGDVVALKFGDRIPADGVFIEGNSLRVKEEEDSRILSTRNSDDDNHDHPFIMSGGSKVVDGRGKMLVLSVGMNTHWNKMMSSSNRCYEQTRLQASVDKIASYFGTFASAIAFFYLLGTVIRHIPGNTKDENVNWRNTIDMIPSVSRCVVEMVEGLSLAVTLAQAFCMKSVMEHGVMVKSMSDCEVIGSATVICSNKVGSLTTNRMEVTEVWVGFDKIIDGSFTNVVDTKVVELFHQAIGLNTSGSVYTSSVSGTTTSECFGSPTEKAILSWGVNKLGMEMEALNQGFTILPKAIATECGILEAGPHVINNGEEVIEGREFRNYTEEERMNRVDGIRVMARSSSLDKLLMVQCLKKKGDVVAVTTGDHELAKESFDGLQFTLKVMRWQRGVYKNIQNYVQFQVPANAAALVINFICAVASGVIPLTASQMECVNLVMVILGVIALAIEQPNEQLMKKPPVNCRDAPLITNVMWRNISMQSVYQIIIILIVWFEGESIFDVDEKVKGMIVFNAFVLCQVFNLFNSRKMEERNVFKDVHKNLPFMSIVVVVIMFQVVMVEFHWLYGREDENTLTTWRV